MKLTEFQVQRLFVIALFFGWGSYVWGYNLWWALAVSLAVLVWALVCIAVVGLSFWLSEWVVRKLYD